jgi:DNA repair exonuclease SbcCD ATPase subunit
MLLRTIFIENNEQQMLTAALLCSFSIPQAGRNFLAYSLNESIDEDNLRVYIALLFNEGGNYCLGALDSEEDGQLAMRVFGQILREAATGERRENDMPYHLLDLNKQQLPAAAAADHQLLSTKKEWVARLLSFQASAQFGPPVEHSPTIIDDQQLDAALAQLDEQLDHRAEQERHESTETADSCETESPRPEAPAAEIRYSDAGPLPMSAEQQNPGGLQDDDWPFPGTDPEQFLQDVEASLMEFSSIADRLKQQKQHSQAQQQTLNSRESQLQEKERLFEQKEEQLQQWQRQLDQDRQANSALRAQQEERQCELDKREEALQQKTRELTQQFKKLNHAKDHFNNTLKNLNEIIRVNEDVLSE